MKTYFAHTNDDQNNIHLIQGENEDDIYDNVWIEFGRENVHKVILHKTSGKPFGLKRTVRKSTVTDE